MNTYIRGFGGYAFGDCFGRGFEERVDFCGVFLEIANCRDAGGHGEWVSAERSGLVDGTERGELIHEFALASEDADGETTTDDFA
jgi:hypothetical protein